MTAILLLSIIITVICHVYDKINRLPEVVQIQIKKINVVFDADFIL